MRINHRQPTLSKRHLTLHRHVLQSPNQHNQTNPTLNQLQIIRQLVNGKYSVKPVFAGWSEAGIFTSNNTKVYNTNTNIISFNNSFFYIKM